MFERTYIEEAKGRLGERVTLAGWVTRTRDLRKFLFIILRDSSGEIQVTVKKGDESIEGASDLTLGREDVIKVTGRAVESGVVHAGVEFIPESIEVLNKAKQPLPFDLFGTVGAELDTRLNYRFMDFRAPKTQAIFRIQNVLLTAFRRFITEKGYLEFQPPCIIASASEGGAELFRLPYFEKEAFLAQSPQLYKQMAAISFEKVFTVTPIWRAEKFNTPTHLNEIRQMDIEQAFADDETVMKVLEETLVYMLEAVREESPEDLEHLSREITVPELPLRRLTYSEAVEQLQKAGEEMVWGEDFTKAQEQRLMEIVGREAFFIKDWPSVQKPFYAMPHEENPDLVHAFDLVYNGIELSSGTQRVHIPEILRQQLRKNGLNPEDFTHYIESFSYGAPPHAGWSIGLERLTMSVTGMENIRECCMFPRDRDRLVP
ncbi:MAG: aspartate--tRNA(Asn) ligase [Candidatus Bathyarchaeota archaeon]|nr:MAG: aspartate--tRNA(Asn) ligase [Candidatus Bathyarchaeota archaeon]